MRDGTYYRASLALERAVAIDPKYTIARARLAQSLFELEYTDRAQSELLKTLGEGKPAGNDGLLIEALRMTFSRNFPDAVPLYRRIADRTSGAERAQALLDLGLALDRNNQPQEALVQFQAAIAQSSAYPAALLRSGILLDRMKKSSESEQAFRRAEELYQALSNDDLPRSRLARDLRLQRHGGFSSRTAVDKFEGLDTLRLPAILEVE
jgi:tetratricopeptide (TPR) repeat protein